MGCINLNDARSRHRKYKHSHIHAYIRESTLSACHETIKAGSGLRMLFHHLHYMCVRTP